MTLWQNLTAQQITTTTIITITTFIHGGSVKTPNTPNVH